jgi:hypothetical protein
VFSKTYVQTTACLSYIRSAACVTFYLINSPFIMGQNVVLGGSDNFSYGVTASERYPDICVLEYVCDFAYGEMYVNVAHLLFLFVFVCTMVRFVLCFIWCLSFCIIVSGKPLRWAMCRINFLNV